MGHTTDKAVGVEIRLTLAFYNKMCYNIIACIALPQGDAGVVLTYSHFEPKKPVRIFKGGIV